ncbi:uncharacterized protein QE450_001106 [Paenibacillus sp. SORGH_AS306]|nr:uncharacterized protein [Paenibacillus sp. SORGH_AS_0306]MDR6110650.1 uncharacterized protein [Paenibacillus sp. SORGH_AS_0338]
MMQFQFRKLAQSDQPIEFHDTLDMSSILKEHSDVLSYTPLQVDVKAAQRVNEVVDVQGTLKLDLQMACVRCLKPVDLNLQFKIQEEFKHGEEPEDVAEDDDTLYVNTDTVDLAPYMEQAAVLELPPGVLCSEDCKGLCPTCGVNLNEQDCGCDNTPIDPRMAGLKDFFK